MERLIPRHAIFLASVSAFVGLIAARAARARQVLRKFEALQDLIADQQPDVARVAEALRGHKVSVLVPAWNEANRVGRLVRQFAELPFPNVEVLVRAGGADGSFTVAREAARLYGTRVLVFQQLPGEGKQRALRALFAEASGDITYLADADGEIEAPVFAGTLAPLLFEGEVASTSGVMPLHEQLTRPLAVAQWVHALAAWVDRDDAASEVAGCNAAVLSSLLTSTRAFEREAPVGTDYALSEAIKSAGHRIAFVHSVLAKTDHVESLGAYVRRLSRWMRAYDLHVNARRAPRGAVLNAAWWGIVTVGTLAEPPLSLLVMPALFTLYALATHPGVFIYRRLEPRAHLTLPAFLLATLALQAAPLVKLFDTVSSSRRSRW